MRYIDDLEIASVKDIGRLEKALATHPEYSEAETARILRKVRAGLENGYIVSYRTWW